MGVHPPAERAKAFVLAPSGGPEKLKVNCLVVTVKIVFKWYNNAVATDIAD